MGISVLFCPESLRLPGGHLPARTSPEPDWHGLLTWGPCVAAGVFYSESSGLSSPWARRITLWVAREIAV